MVDKNESTLSAIFYEENQSEFDDNELEKSGSALLSGNESVNSNELISLHETSMIIQLPPKSPKSLSSISPNTSISGLHRIINHDPTYSPRWLNDSDDEAEPLHLSSILNKKCGNELPPIRLNFNEEESISLEIKHEFSPKKNEKEDIKPFYFPYGQPISKTENAEKLKIIMDYINEKKELTINDFGEIAKIMLLPFYIRKIIFIACCRINNKPVNDKMIIRANDFIRYWKKLTSKYHDKYSRFVYTLSFSSSNSPGRNYLIKDDFYLMIYDIINNYPGLEFLKNTPQFHNSYIKIVTTRIFWNVSKTWNGKISINELKKSNLLDVLYEFDTNLKLDDITDYFNYEHYYVIYSKFWDLDNDHDLLICFDDMKNYCNRGITDKVIDRIFSKALIKGKNNVDTIGLEEFTEFILAEENKKHSKSLEYWFRCIDLNGDGIISLYEIEEFYKYIIIKCIELGFPPTKYQDVAIKLCEMVDVKDNRIRLMDIKKSQLGHKFFNTLVNVYKCIDQESSDAERERAKFEDGRLMSDWDKFCATEYEELMVNLITENGNES